MNNLEEIVSSYSLLIIGVASILLFTLSGISLLKKKQSNVVKRLLFISIVLTAILPTLFLAFSTLYINALSSSNGPVHWHTDIEIWACGREINLRDPKGLSNKIGTNTLHEHNDKRIHLEGVVMQPADASLGKFFQVIGGLLSENSISVPVEHGVEQFTNGDTCGDAAPRELQVFVYKTAGSSNYYQEKIDDPASYVISPEGAVPPGDCVIVEFDVRKKRTEKLCTSYRAAKQTGKLKEEILPIE